VISLITFVIGVLLAMQISAQQTIKVGIVGNAENHQISWTTEQGLNYLVEVSPDLVNWMDTGIVQPGTGEIVAYGFSTPSEPKMFYRIRVRPGAVRIGFDDFELERQDDSPSEFSPIGFSINLFGNTWKKCYVNFNGNITFDNPLDEYTPNPLQVIGVPIIAPFWADVDTRGAGSNLISYGNKIINGHQAFGVNWVKAGYYQEDLGATWDAKLNSFQLVLIDRSEIGTGNFDIEYNYDLIRWETGEAYSSGGVNGYGGKPARAGLTNGTNQTIELQYSAQTLLQLDSNPNTGFPNFSTGLIYRSRNSTVPGRFVFQVRSGQVLGALSVYAGDDQFLDSGSTSTTLAGTASNPAGGAVTVLWTIVEGQPGVTISDPTTLNPTVTFPANAQIRLQLTATSVVDPNITAADTITIYQ